MNDDKRLIEDYLPIQAISAEASREKSVRKGHISTLHLWWARRPLVACRAAVYGALVPASQFVPANGPDNKKQSLGRANAAKFVTELCKYPGSPRVIGEAQKHILDAHAERLTAELAEVAKTGQWPAWVDEFKWPKGEKQVTRHDIEKGRAPRPRVLDMFAGGGAIPLEALRLSCEAYALDLNPVAHIIQLCTLVYPQKYGKPDATACGMTGPKNTKGETTWGGLAEEVRYWGNWVLERVRREIGDLYPPIPDPEVWDTPPEIAFERETGRWNVTKPGKPKRGAKLANLSRTGARQATMYENDDDADDGEAGFGAEAALPPGFLQPVAYLWTRTVRCKNPSCGATVPLVRQTWLCKKEKKKTTPGRYVALEVVTPKRGKQVSFDLRESGTESGLRFDPGNYSTAGNATCAFCGTVADNDYVKDEGQADRIGAQLMAVVSRRLSAQGRAYLSANSVAPRIVPDDDAISRRIDERCRTAGLSAPDEPVVTDAKNANFCILYGLDRFRKLFSPRQLLAMVSFVAAVREVHVSLAAGRESNDNERANAVTSMLACYVDRAADHWSSLCAWNPVGEKLQHTFGRQAIPMVWDYAEAHPWGGSVGDWTAIVLNAENAISAGMSTGCRPAHVVRGTAIAQPWPDGLVDAVITDPPYYDNVPYADISDFFYVWLRRTIGPLYPEHFAGEGTPKKQEAVADATRHGGDKSKAVRAYEAMMGESLAEAGRALKPDGMLVVVYAHKTTLGWSTLVDAMRRAGFVVSEAWPLDTENRTRLRGMASAALASSIFLVAHKRSARAGVGNYEDDVQPELRQIVLERVETLWDLGITGADLVIAAVGAGLRAFTKYERVEYANGEEVPAERFLAEVEGVVLDVMLEQIAGKVARGVTAVDPASRFYVLWRYVYKAAAIEAGEAIVFTYGQHVELDGQRGLANGRNPLVEKKKSTYRLRDFTERGKDEKLGLPGENGDAAPLVDALHRVLWIMENRPRLMTEFLRESRVNRDQLRVLAQALAGPALKGGELGEVSAGSELAALTKLTSNWKSVVEDAISPLERVR